VRADQLKRNAILHGLDGVFFFAGLTLFNRGQIVPKMFEDLGGSDFLLGLVALVYWLLHMVPQTISAKAVEGMAHKRRAVLLGLFFQRVGWLGFLISIFFRWDSRFTLAAFFIALTLNRLGTGMVGPVWTDWYAKTTSNSVWASVLGFRRAAAGVIGVALGFLIHWIMANFEAPTRYQILLSLAVLCYAASYLFVALVREERTDGLPSRQGTSWGEYFRDLLRIAFQPGDYSRFVIGCLMVSAPMAVMVTFLTRYGLTYPGVSDGVTGTFTAFYQGALALGAMAGGLLSDRRNPVAPFQVSPLLFIAAVGIACISPHPAAVSAAWACLGLAFGMRLTALMPAVFRFAEKGRIPSYMAATVTVIGIPRAFAPPLAGYLLDRRALSFPQLFIICGALSFLGWLMFFRVKPPPRATTGEES